MNIDFTFKVYGSSPSSDMAGFNWKLSVISGCMKPTKSRENARNQGYKLQPDNNCLRKNALTSAKAAHNALLLEKTVLQSSIENDVHGK